MAPPVALLLALSAWSWPYTNDDAYITFRYARALATGSGPYFNPGEHVEGYTNFLWMLLLAPFAWASDPDVMPLAARLLGVACQTAAVALAGAAAATLARRRGDGPVAVAAVTFVAAGVAGGSPPVALNAVSGLETGFYSLLVTGAAAAALLRPAAAGAPLAAALFGLAALTRPEAGVVFAAWWLARVVVGSRAGGDGGGRPPAVDGAAAGDGAGAKDGDRPRARGSAVPGLGARGVEAAVFALPVAGHLALRLWLYDGEWLPNTWYAKAGGFEKLPPGRYVWDALHGPLLGVPGAASALVGLGLAARRVASALPLVAAGVAGALLPFVTGADWMLGGRMVVPYLPLLSVVAALGWSGMLLRALPGSPRVAAALVALSVPVAAVAQGSSALRDHHEVLVRAEGYRTGHRALGRWLCERASPGDAVALMDVGVVGYACPGLGILDISGLTDRHIARSPGEFLAKDYDPAYVLSRSPRWIVVVLRARGIPYRPLPPGIPIYPWTTIEERLMATPAFRAAYTRPRPPRRGAPWWDGIVANLGASTLFEHAEPGSHYLLTVFERQDGVPAQLLPPG